MHTYTRQPGTLCLLLPLLLGPFDVPQHLLPGFPVDQDKLAVNFRLKLLRFALEFHHRCPDRPEVGALFVVRLRAGESQTTPAVVNGPQDVDRHGAALRSAAADDGAALRSAAADKGDVA